MTRERENEKARLREREREIDTIEQRKRCEWGGGKHKEAGRGRGSLWLGTPRARKECLQHLSKVSRVITPLIRRGVAGP